MIIFHFSKSYLAPLTSGLRCYMWDLRVTFKLDEKIYGVLSYSVVLFFWC